MGGRSGAAAATLAALPLDHDCVAGGAVVAAFAAAAIFYFRTTVEDYNGRAVKAGYSVSPCAIQRFWYGWKMWSLAFTATWHAIWGAKIATEWIVNSASRHSM